MSKNEQKMAFSDGLGGAQTAFIGCIGKDSFGESLKRTLAANNVCIDGLQQTDKASTTLAVVTISESGERNFSFIRKPGADMLIDEKAALASIRGTGILHFGSVSLTDPGCGAVIRNVVKAARAAGSIITYDPNYRSPLWESEGELDDRTKDRQVAHHFPW